MIDPDVEELIPPTVAARYYPRRADGRKVHVSKVYRDIQRGHRGIRLEALRTPRLMTSRPAIARFFRLLSAPDLPAAEATAEPRRRGRDDPGVERQLDRLGF